MDRDQLTTGRGTARKMLREIIVGVSQVTKSVAYNIKPSAEASRSPVTAIAHCFARKGFKWMQRWQTIGDRRLRDKIIVKDNQTKDAIAWSKKSRINPDRLNGGGFYSDY